MNLNREVTTLPNDRNPFVRKCKTTASEHQNNSIVRAAVIYVLRTLNSLDYRTPPRPEQADRPHICGSCSKQTFSHRKKGDNHPNKSDPPGSRWFVGSTVSSRQQQKPEIPGSQNELKIISLGKNSVTQSGHKFPPPRKHVYRQTSHIDHRGSQKAFRSTTHLSPEMTGLI